MTRAPGFTDRRFDKNVPRSKSRWGSRSTLFTTTTSTARNITGYLSGFSSLSVPRRPCCSSAPTSNSAGQTRLPTFSISTRSSASSCSASRPSNHRGVEVALAAEPVRRCSRRRSAAPRPPARRRRGVVAMSPSRTPIRANHRARRNVALDMVVLPAPGEDMRFTVRTPARAKASRLDRPPGRSRRSAQTSTHVVPVAAYPAVVADVRCGRRAVVVVLPLAWSSWSCRGAPCRPLRRCT